MTNKQLNFQDPLRDSKPKKLRFNKKFVPLAREDDEEFFPNGIFDFNITKLTAFICQNPEIFPVEQISVKSYARWSSENLSEQTVVYADVSKPIILGEISPGRFNVIDGNHRLERARRDGLETIPAYRVMVEHHIAFLTSEKAYQAYIQYWNEKVRDLEDE